MCGFGQITICTQIVCCFRLPSSSPTQSTWYFYSRGSIVTHHPIQNFCLGKLQNARLLVYISLNHRSAYCVSLPSSCKTCGPKDPAFCKKTFYNQGMKYDCNWLPLLQSCIIFFIEDAATCNVSSCSSLLLHVHFVWVNMLFVSFYRSL